MPKKDFSQVAFSVVQQATGEKPKEARKSKNKSRAQAINLSWLMSANSIRIWPRNSPRFPAMARCGMRDAVFWMPETQKDGTMLFLFIAPRVTAPGAMAISLTEPVFLVLRAILAA